MRSMLRKECLQCKCVIRSRSERAKFCSSYCRNTYYNKRRQFDVQGYVPVKKTPDEPKNPQHNT
jgi:hypothetical protein